MTVDSDVLVAGVAMTRFGGPQRPLHHRIFDAGRSVLADAGLDYSDVDSVFLGAVLAPPMFGINAVKDLGLTGVPIINVQNASATGAACFYLAAQAVRSGRAQVAMALGFEDPAAHGWGASFNELRNDVPIMDAIAVPAAVFSMWAVRRMHERGTSIETLAAIAAKNLNNARLNPFAERQRPNPVTVDDVLSARMLAFPHTTQMAAPQGAGAAAAIVVSAEFARTMATRPRVKISASQSHTERYTEGQVLAFPIIGPPEMVKRAADAAYEEAGIGPQDLGLASFHDAFAIEELLYYEEVGLCAPGDADRLVHDGVTQLGGRIPVSTDGGFIGRGHPGGPTGLAQIWELTNQLRGTAGSRQLDSPRHGLAHTPGAGSVCYTHILSAH